MNKRIGKLLIAFVFASLALLVISSLVMAAPADAGRTAANRASDVLSLAPAMAVTSAPTGTITGTTMMTHPVAWAISAFFDISYTQVISLHESGLGFGVIARAYLLARASLSTTTPLSPTLVLEMFQSGMGWGQFKRLYGIPPGGMGLGSIMGNGKGGGNGNNGGNVNSDRSGGGNGNKPDCPGKSCNAPGQGAQGKWHSSKGVGPTVTRGPKK